MKPLNGEKTHPLSAHAIGVLDELSRGPVPAQQINAAVVNRLMRENLARRIDRPSPYKTVRGNISYLEIIDAGRAVLTPRADGG